MKKNMSGLDRVLRLFIAAIVVALYYFNVVEGTLAYVLMALAGIFVLTSFVSFCPLYAIFRMNSFKQKK
ncbi:DUF2892 domain-containing protein [Flagellimonas hymeniacidonis]|uniref:DUF2892 domain-containing protein n=1 Tax=Flagellimonas hymeniacidonis TaxID=2603628 RepID=A0A5C8V697_9FLAO|nr:DUF2892 domain-containing protein [Flagellimonas hymeniacidonis]TXN37385.1 DUF2892 domain-containing protein [Flagellimonas hymeniacidonis]